MAASKKRSQISDEDYWSSSSASKISAKGINLFDEDQDFESTKEILRKRAFDEDDDDGDFINWDGTPANIDVKAGSARFRASPDRPATTQPARQPPSQPRSQPRSHAALPPHVSGLTIDDAVQKGPPRQPGVADVAKLEAEISFLKRSLQASKAAPLTRLPPRDLIKRIIMGQPFLLEAYRSKEQKLALLDEAVALHDGNAITTVVLFLRRSLKPALFQQELTRRPAAVEHYVHFLRQRGQHEQLADLLGMLGRTDDAAMLKYKQATAVKNPETKLRTLQTCYRAHFQSDGWLAHEADLLQQQVALIERQLPIEASDVQEAERGAAKFREMPRAASLLDSPLITTLYYCSLYHNDLQENCLASPKAIRNAHRLCERQFAWAQLAARVKARAWADVDALFTAKGWLGGTKMKAVLPFDRVLQALHKLGGAPRQVLCKYCNLVEPAELRLDLGKKYNCHESVIETYSQQKDRQAIQHYQSRLKVNSPEWFCANDVLHNSSIKWKN